MVTPSAHLEAGILQIQRSYELDGNKQTSDNIHRMQTSGHGPEGASQPPACLASLTQNTGRQEVAGDPNMKAGTPKQALEPA